MEYKKMSIPKPQKWKDPGAIIYKNAIHKIPSPEQEKHEEIKWMAWELSKTALLHTITVEGKRLESPDQVMRWCWGCAEGFYKLAKEQEKKDAKI